MIQNDYHFGNSTVYCDGQKCDESIEVEGFDGHPPSYRDISDEIKEYGWKIKKEDGDWVHLCENCNRKNL